MYRETREVWRLYPPWAEERETKWLRDMSNQGWHFDQFQSGKYLFQQGEPRDMVYRKDYARGSRNRHAYLKPYKNAGWEHVSDRMGWHYFRAPVGDADTGPFADNSARILGLKSLQNIIMAILIFQIIVMMALINALPAFPSALYPSFYMFFQAFLYVLMPLLDLVLIYVLVHILLRIRELS